MLHDVRIQCSMPDMTSWNNWGIVDRISREGKPVKHIAIIRTGGQTGADRGGLDAAQKLGVPIAGWCPKGGLAEDCSHAPGLHALYPVLMDTPSSGYEQRTGWNVRDAHATLIVAPLGVIPMSGTEMTVDFAQRYQRPLLVVNGVSEEEAVLDWVASLSYGITLNVAGPRESKCPGVHDITMTVVEKLLQSDGYPACDDDGLL